VERGGAVDADTDEKFVKLKVLLDNMRRIMGVNFINRFITSLTTTYEQYQLLKIKLSGSAGGGYLRNERNSRNRKSKRRTQKRKKGKRKKTGRSKGRKRSKSGSRKSKRRNSRRMKRRSRK
jgi:hypothetical protein